MCFFLSLFSFCACAETHTNLRLVFTLAVEQQMNIFFLLKSLGLVLRFACWSYFYICDSIHRSNSLNSIQETSQITIATSPIRATRRSQDFYIFRMLQYILKSQERKKNCFEKCRPAQIQKCPNQQVNMTQVHDKFFYYSLLQTVNPLLICC